MLPFVLGVGCSSGGGGEEISSIIGSGGGSIDTGDGFELIIPAGALDSDVEITVERLSGGPEYAAGPEYLLGPEGQTFNVPVQVRLPVDEVELPPDTIRLLRAYTAPGGTDDYTTLTVLESGADYILTETTHFSSFLAGNVEATAVASAEKYPRGVACDGTSIYWATGGSAENMLEHSNQGYIVSAAIGGSEVTPVSTAQEEPMSVVVAGDALVWITGGRGVDDPLGAVPSTVVRSSKDGVKVATLYEGGYPGAVAADATHAYWSDRDLGEILSVPLDGGEATVIATGQGHDVKFITVDDANVYWTTGTSSSGASGTVATVAKTGGEVTVLASGQANPAGLAVANGIVAWANEGDGTVMTVRSTGGAATLVRTSTAPSAVALVNDVVYYTDIEEGRVFSVPVTGGTATLIADGLAMPWHLDVANGIVIWSDAGMYDYEGDVSMISLE